MCSQLYAGNNSSYDFPRVYGTEISAGASLSDDNQLPLPVETSDQPRPSTSRCDTEESGRMPVPETVSPTPCGSRRRSSSPAAWPPRPFAMSFDGGYSDDDNDARPAASCSSQAVESFECLRDAIPSTRDTRGKQPITCLLYTSPSPRD